jgi:uncharacterized membrane protein HdeD (DUF308 family)
MMIGQLISSGLEDVRRNWGWFLALGIALIALGVAALGAVSLTTITSVILFGWFIFFSGVAETFASFSARKWSGFLLHICAALFYTVIGLSIATQPLSSTVVATWLLAMLFMFGGLFRMMTSALIRYPNWGWAFFDGVVSLVLGGAIMAQWQFATLWMIGACVGINLIFRGLAWAMLALSVRRFPEALEPFKRVTRREHANRY